jgi:hypothetical protein
MIEREELFADKLLEALARYLGQPPDEPARSASREQQRSPAMLAAWAQATRVRSGNGNRRGRTQ